MAAGWGSYLADGGPVTAPLGPRSFPRNSQKLFRHRVKRVHKGVGGLNHASLGDCYRPTSHAQIFYWSQKL